MYHYIVPNRFALFVKKSLEKRLSKSIIVEHVGKVYVITVVATLFLYHGEAGERVLFVSVTYAIKKNQKVESLLENLK